MIDFHTTGYGRRFFDGQLPQLIRNIEKLTEALRFHAKVELVKLIRDNGTGHVEELFTQAESIQDKK